VGVDICVRILEKVQLEHFQDFFPTADIFGLIKPGTMGWEQHLARMGAKRCAYRVLVGKETN